MGLQTKIMPVTALCARMRNIARSTTFSYDKTALFFSLFMKAPMKLRTYFHKGTRVFFSVSAICVCAMLRSNFIFEAHNCCINVAQQLDCRGYYLQSSSTSFVTRRQNRQCFLSLHAEALLNLVGREATSRKSCC